MRFEVQETTLPVMLEIAAAHGLSYWDASILARALGCRELLSEDMPHGREVTNPFH